MNDLFIINDYVVTKEVTSGTVTSTDKVLTVHDRYALVGAFFTAKNSLYSDDTIYVNASSTLLRVIIHPTVTFNY